MLSRPAARPTALLLALTLVAGCTGTPPGTPPPTLTQPTAQPTAEAPPESTPAQPPLTAAPTEAPAGSPASHLLPDIGRIAAGETPAGWQEALSADGVCRIAVPADWDTESMAGGAMSPGLEVTVLLSNDQLSNWGSWEAYTEAGETAYFGSDRLVLLETGELFVMAAGPSTPDASFLVGRNIGDSVCGILLTVRGNAVGEFLAVGHEILYSLAPVD